MLTIYEWPKGSLKRELMAALSFQIVYRDPQYKWQMRTYTHTTKDNFRKTNYNNIQACALWDEGGLPVQNPTMHRVDMQKDPKSGFGFRNFLLQCNSDTNYAIVQPHKDSIQYNLYEYFLSSRKIRHCRSFLHLDFFKSLWTGTAVVRKDLLQQSLL